MNVRLLVLRLRNSIWIHRQSTQLERTFAGQNLPAFVARSRSLVQLRLITSTVSSSSEYLPILQAVDPTALTSLKIEILHPSPANQVGLPIAHLINLESLVIPSGSCTTEFVASLSKLPRLKSLQFDSPPTHPLSPTSTHFYTPALVSSRIYVPVYFRLGGPNDETTFNDFRNECRGDFDSIRAILTHWAGEWTSEDAKAIVALAKEAKVELEEGWEMAIEYTVLMDEKRDEKRLDIKSVDDSNDEVERRPVIRAMRTRRERSLSCVDTSRLVDVDLIVLEYRNESNSQ